MYLCLLISIFLSGVSDGGVVPNMQLLVYISHVYDLGRFVYILVTFRFIAFVLYVLGPCSSCASRFRS